MRRAVRPSDAVCARRRGAQPIRRHRLADDPVSSRKGVPCALRGLARGPDRRRSSRRSATRRARGPSDRARLPQFAGRESSRAHQSSRRSDRRRGGVRERERIRGRAVHRSPFCGCRGEACHGRTAGRPGLQRVHDVGELRAASARRVAKRTLADGSPPRGGASGSRGDPGENGKVRFDTQRH